VDRWGRGVVFKNTPIGAGLRVDLERRQKMAKSWQLNWWPYSWLFSFTEYRSLFASGLSTFDLIEEKAEFSG